MPAANELRAHTHLLAEQVTQKHFQQFPELAARYGAYGRRRCLEDAEFHLSFLAAAIEAGLDTIFFDYVEWTKTVLTSRGIAESDLVANLRNVREVLVAHFAGDAAKAMADILDVAIEKLPGMPNDVPTFIDRSTLYGAVAARYLEHLIAGDEPAANREIAAALERGISLTDVCSNVFEAVQHEVGRLWQLNRMSVATEHFCSAVTQRTAMQVCGRRALLPPGARKRALAMCVPGEQHDIGLRIITDLLALEGWQTFYLGPNVPANAAAQMCAERQIDVLLLSASLPSRLAMTKEVVELVRKDARLKNIRIIVGGRAFIRPEVWRVTGADAYATSTASALALLRDQ